MAENITFSQAFPTPDDVKKITIGDYLTFLERSGDVGRGSTYPNETHLKILREILNPDTDSADYKKYQKFFQAEGIELTLNSSMKELNTASALHGLTEAFKENANIPLLRDRKGIKGKTDAEILQNLKDKNLEKYEPYLNERFIFPTKADNDKYTGQKNIATKTISTRYHQTNNILKGFFNRARDSKGDETVGQSIYESLQDKTYLARNPNRAVGAQITQKAGAIDLFDKVRFNEFVQAIQQAIESLPSDDPTSRQAKNLLKIKLSTAIRQKELFSINIAADISNFADKKNAAYFDHENGLLGDTSQKTGGKGTTPLNNMAKMAIYEQIAERQHQLGNKFKTGVHELFDPKQVAAIEELASEALTESIKTFDTGRINPVTKEPIIGLDIEIYDREKGKAVPFKKLTVAKLRSAVATTVQNDTAFGATAADRRVAAKAMLGHTQGHEAIDHYITQFADAGANQDELRKQFLQLDRAWVGATQKGTVKTWLEHSANKKEFMPVNPETNTPYFSYEDAIETPEGRQLYGFGEDIDIPISEYDGELAPEKELTKTRKGRTVFKKGERTGPTAEEFIALRRKIENDLNGFDLFDKMDVDKQLQLRDDILRRASNAPNPTEQVSMILDLILSKEEGHPYDYLKKTSFISDEKIDALSVYTRTLYDLGDPETVKIWDKEVAKRTGVDMRQAKSMVQNVFGQEVEDVSQSKIPKSIGEMDQHVYNGKQILENENINIDNFTEGDILREASEVDPEFKQITNQIDNELLNNYNNPTREISLKGFTPKAVGAAVGAGAIILGSGATKAAMGALGPVGNVINFNMIMEDIAKSHNHFDHQNRLRGIPGLAVDKYGNYVRPDPEGLFQGLSLVSEGVSTLTFGTLPSFQDLKMLWHDLAVTVPDAINEWATGIDLRDRIGGVPKEQLETPSPFGSPISQMGMAAFVGKDPYDYPEFQTDYPDLTEQMGQVFSEELEKRFEPFKPTEDAGLTDPTFGGGKFGAPSGEITQKQTISRETRPIASQIEDMFSQENKDIPKRDIFKQLFHIN